MSARRLPFLQRPALVVSDLERALEVYRDLLGFAVGFIGVDAADSYSYQVFDIPPETGTRFCVLSTEQQERGLALIEVPGRELYAPSQMRLAAIVVQVADLADMLERARRSGLRCLEPRRHPAPERGAARVEACFHDPDGHPIVIYQLLGSAA